MQVLFNRKVVYIDLLDKLENIIKNFKKTTRQEQRWGTSKYNFGIEIIENNYQCIDDFINIYHDTMCRLKVSNYMFFNREYFKNILSHTNATILFATYKNKSIAGGILLFYKHYVSGHLGGTLSEYIKFSPNAYLYTEMIRYSQKKGCRYFLLGGGTTAEENDSLYKYKQNFSKNATNFYIGKKIHNKTVYTNILKQWKLAYPELYNQFKEQVLCYHNITS
jgi:lipid II:glycine glycyltransferase (peptidoglycan interpeptide bridge formation enzyme)